MVLQLISKKGKKLKKYSYTTPQLVDEVVVANQDEADYIEVESQTLPKATPKANPENKFKFASSLDEYKKIKSRHIVSSIQEGDFHVDLDDLDQNSIRQEQMSNLSLLGQQVKHDLNQKQMIKQAFVLREVLDKPLSLRSLDDDN